MNKIEEYFKNIINWKYYYYLCDKLTEYEDDGMCCEISICVKVNGFYQFIYSSHNNDYNKSKLTTWEIFGAERTDGIFYTIYISNDLYYNQNTEKIEEYFNKISNKSKRYPADMIYVLVVKPID